MQPIRSSSTPDSIKTDTLPVASPTADSSNLKQAYKEQARQILSESPTIKTSLTQFAFLHCSAELTDSGLEGKSTAKASMQYWQKLTELWLSNPSLLADPNLSKDQVEE